MTRLLFWLLFPFVLPQALYVRLTAPRHPGAGGAQEGRSGSGQTMRVLVIGDSLAAGVGAESFRDALAGQTGAALASRLGRHVHWKVVGRSGATSHEIASELLPIVQEQPFDVVVISAGVNDTISLKPMKRWLEGLGTLSEAVGRNWPGAHVALVGLPPLEDFPLLPQPLRALMGMRAGNFDKAGRNFAERSDHWVHVAVDFSPAPGMFAEDGFHPSEISYRKLGSAVAAELVRAMDEGAHRSARAAPMEWARDHASV